MSSFKRKGPASATSNARQLLPGTRASANSPSVAYLSSGIASLDDVLGGGIPLGSVIVILTPDVHSAWGTLLQRYFIAQGIVLNQRVAIVSEPHDASLLVKGCMWLPAAGGDNATSGSSEAANDLEDEVTGSDEKIRIAWRYEKMQQFQTTVGTFASGGYCDGFELSSQIPESVVSLAVENDQLTTIEIPSSPNTFDSCLQAVKQYVAGRKSDTRRQAVRLSVPDLGNPSWGDTSARDIFTFLFRLRTTIRSSDIATLVTFPAHLSTEWPHFFAEVTSGALSNEVAVEYWYQKVSLLTDGCLLFTSFGADPSLASLFKTYHGALRILRSPTMHTLLPASHKHSVLRGLRASSAAGASSQSRGENTLGTGENNLAFRCTRKRFVIETLHLDAEGGVGERRTNAPPTAAASASSAPHSHTHARTGPIPGAASTVMALEDTSLSVGVQGDVVAPLPPEGQSKSNGSVKKKRVAFHSDRPDLYDF